MSGTNSKTGTEQLEGAYALETPEDNVDYYRDFARSYDEGFATDLGYVYPENVAREFLSAAGPEDTPVADVGAGTGLLAEHLGGLTIDAIDISPEMLEKAAAKGLYRRRIVADLTGPLDLPDAAYGALVSSGTFTHGHVGPGAFAELLRIGKPGALYCFGINLGAYDSAGFGSALARLVATERITPVNYREVRYYARTDHEHADDTGVVALFRKR